jgi:tetratricopeptide (TPR) repeat protein
MTARPPLTPMQARELQSAQRLVRDGKGEGAIGRIRPLLAGGLVHADAYALFASACRMQGLLVEARTSLNAAINLDPANAANWAALGELLMQMDDAEKAEVALRRAAELDPAPIRSAQAQAHAVALRMLDRSAEALDMLASFASQADAASATLALHGHLLGDAGRFDEAVQHYRSAIAAEPANLDAHETLTRLLPQIGEGDAALDSYRRALVAIPANEALWASALGSARALGAMEQLLEWSSLAIGHHPHRTDFTVYRADAMGATGDVAGALALLEPLATGDRPNGTAAIQAAHWRLVAGDAGGAELYAQTAVDLAPELQTGWAYLGTCWRLLGDSREIWLNDYDRLTTTIALEAPAGFADVASFLTQLRDTLDAMHLTMTHPADQSLREGTQTRGHLFLRRNAMIEALGLGLHRQIEAWLATLSRDPSHPFLRRNSGRIGFKHSWSVKLRDSGFHVSHIHQDGWLSSAFYVALPQAVTGGAMAEGLPQGALTFGVPDASLGLNLELQRVVRPEPGMLVLFPSYVWHGTVPFNDAEPRLTVAFDALPL